MSVNMKSILILILVLCANGFAQAPQEKSTTVFGAKINYIEAGDPAKPKVILLHGLGGSILNWSLNTAPIAQNYHVIALDQVGFGKSDKPALKYRVGTYADFLDKFMAELKIEATSGGGMVTVVINGAKQIQSLKMDPEAVSKDDVEMLQDLILAAINDAQRKADEALSQQMGGLMGGLKIPGLF